jgi:hypothetical protein
MRSHVLALLDLWLTVLDDGTLECCGAMTKLAELLVGKLQKFKFLIRFW